MQSDEILWEGMLRGEQEMFISLYKRYYHTLLFVGRGRVKEGQQVKDAIHQLFLYLWEKRHTIQPAKSVKSYLITSFLRILAVDGKKADKFSDFQFTYLSSFKSSIPTPEDDLVRKEEDFYQQRELAIHILDLPARQRELLYLKFYDGLSYDEIVMKTGLSHRTVYNKIHEALKKLRVDLVGNEKHKLASL